MVRDGSMSQNITAVRTNTGSSAIRQTHNQSSPDNGPAAQSGIEAQMETPSQTTAKEVKANFWACQ